MVGTLETADLVERTDQGDTAAGDHALLDRRPGGVQGILDARLLLLHLHLGGGTDLDQGHTAGQFGQTLLELFAVVVRGGLLDLLANLLTTGLDVGLGAGPIDDGGLFLADLDLLGGTQFVQGRLLQRQADLFGDHGRTGQDGDVLQHGLAAVTEAGGLDRTDLDDTAQAVDHQRRQSLALDVLGDDQQGLAGLGDPLKHREQLADVGDLLVVQQDEGVFEFRLLGLLLVDEVGGEVAAVELHALDDVELVVQGLALLDGDHTLLTDLAHGLGDDAADGLVGVGGDGADLGDLLVVRTGLGDGLQLGHRRLDGLVDAAFQVHRVHAGGHRLEALADHGLGQHGRGGGAVTGHVAGLGGDLLDHLGAHVLELVLQFDLLGDGHAVLGHGRGAEGFLQHHVAALGTQGHLDRVGQDVDTVKDAGTGLVSEIDLFCTHCCVASVGCRVG